MDEIDKLAYHTIMAQQWGSERETLKDWWRDLPDDVDLTKADLVPLYNSQLQILAAQINRERVEASHIEHVYDVRPSMVTREPSSRYRWPWWYRLAIRILDRLMPATGRTRRG